jgi:hypothetical protein
MAAAFKGVTDGETCTTVDLPAVGEGQATSFDTKLEGSCAAEEEDLFGSASRAAMTELGLTVTEITAFVEMFDGLPENNAFTLLLQAAGEKFTATGIVPTLETATAALKTLFASAEVRTALKSIEGVDADLLAAFITASENASCDALQAAVDNAESFLAFVRDDSSSASVSASVAAAVVVAVAGLLF